MVELAQAEAFAPARRTALLIFGVGLMLAVVLAVGVILLARQIARPVLRIRDAALRVAEGDLTAQAPVLTQDEIGVLAGTFNDMTGKLRLLYDDLKQEIKIQQINTAADKMQRLLNELLELSRIGRQLNPLEDISLTEVAREAVELVTGRIKERGAEVEVASGMPVVCADRVRLLEAYQNLIDNAVKFMGPQPNPRVEIGVEQKEGEVVCFVRDNGIGIELRYHEKIFGLFDRLDREGTGIGLALVKRIVEVHGGRIWVESEGPGRGSTFWFTLHLDTDDTVRRKAS